MDFISNQLEPKLHSSGQFYTVGNRVLRDMRPDGVASITIFKSINDASYEEPPKESDELVDDNVVEVITLEGIYRYFKRVTISQKRGETKIIEFNPN